jgi:uncharacterized membrane protein YqjE
LLALLEARVELVSIELREEAERRKRLLILGVVAAVFLVLGLVMFSFLLVVIFWDTHRVAAILGVTLVHSGVGAWAVLRIRAIHRDPVSPFSATLAEFRKDLDMLRGRHE